jgi:hypothetical protein
VEQSRGQGAAASRVEEGGWLRNGGVLAGRGAGLARERPWRLSGEPADASRVACGCRGPICCDLLRFLKGWRTSDQLGFQMDEFCFLPSIA